MNGKLLKFILVISLLLNFSIIAAAAYFYCRDTGCWRIGRDRGFRKMAFLSKELGLTPEQQNILQEKDSAFHKSIKEIREEVIRKRRGILDLLREDEPDRDDIKTALSEISELQKRIQILVVDHILEERGIFTREQRAKYLDLLKDRCEIEKFYGREKDYRRRGDR